jgi:hypothetical protein
MILEGSCHCGAVKFSFVSHTPYPYMRCYCSICRKTQGGGGFSINIMGEAQTLKVKGEHNLARYRAYVKRGASRVRSPGRRHFCRKCGSSLWLWDPRWPQWIYPFASAIDTPLPRPSEVQHVLLNYAPGWVEVPKRRRDRYFREFPREAIIDWHRKRGLYD